ncbi:MAG: amidohydrolase [Hyphomicrobiaceae bacterium]
MDAILANARLADGSRTDILIRDGTIAGLGALAAHAPATVDLGGRLVLPALIDAHVHLDKTLLGFVWQPHRAENTTRGRIAAEKDLRRMLSWPVETCGGELLRLALSHGTTAVRSHVDIDEVTGLRNVETLIRLRETWSPFIDIQLVAFPQSGLSHNRGTIELLDEAMRMGCDLVGGLDPLGIDDDLDGHLDTIFELAQRHGKGLDIHLHDLGEPGLSEILAIAERTRTGGLGGRVTVSHAFALGSVTPDRAAFAADRLAAAGVTILTSAPGAAPMPPIARLRAAGVRVVAGSDNIRDAWSPFGNANMLERCWLVAYRGGFRTDADIETTFDLATSNAASLLGLARGLAEGSRADLIAVPTDTLARTIIERPRPDLVLRQGRAVHCDADIELGQLPRLTLPYLR